MRCLCLCLRPTPITVNPTHPPTHPDYTHLSRLVARQYLAQYSKPVLVRRPHRVGAGVKVRMAGACIVIS